MDTISARRVVGFAVLTLAIVVGTLAFGFATSTSQPSLAPTEGPTSAPVAPGTPQLGAASPSFPLPSPSSSFSASPAPPTSPTRSLRPGQSPAAVASDAPLPGGTIPSFVPVPSGPVP